MRIAQFNNLYFYFVCSQLIFLSAYFYHTPLISDTINTNRAIWMHVIGIFWSAVGYFTVRFAYLSQQDIAIIQTEDRQYFFNKMFYIISYLVIILGSIVNVLQIILYIPLMEHISKIFSGAFNINIRDIFLLPSSEGGLSGIIKIWGNAPLSIYLMSLGLLNFIKLDDLDRQKLKQLSLLALVAILIRVFLSLEHKNIMAVMLANIFLIFKEDYTRKKLNLVFIISFFALAGYLFSKRLENYGVIDFVMLYLKIGLVNFQLMIDSCSSFTYGFSTILAPLTFVFQFFNQPIPDILINSQFEWVWNPVQYFSSYAFQDFGYFYFVLFYIVGIILFYIDLTALKKKNIKSVVIYFIVLFGVISFLFVPVIRNMDYWFTFLLPIVLISLTTKQLFLRK